MVSLLKAPDAQLEGKKKLRHIRALAKSYRIQQQLFQMAFQRRETINPLNASALDPHLDLLLEMNLPEVGRKPKKDRFDTPALLDALRACSQSKRQLLRTWIDYQMQRLDLYNALGVAPPER